MYLLHLLALAIVLLVLCLAAAVGAAVAYARGWLAASAAFADLKSWYRGMQQQGTVESLMRNQLRREMLRRQPQAELPKAAAVVSERPPSSIPPPLDDTWPGTEGALPKEHSGKRLAELATAKTGPIPPGWELLKPLSARPPPLPDPAKDWADSHLLTEELTPSEVASVPSVPVSAAPIPLVQKPQDKPTLVWPKRQLPIVQ